MSGAVNHKNCIIWEGGQSPLVITTQHQRNSPKSNVWCGLMEDRVIGPFMFVERTITGSVTS